MKGSLVITTINPPSPAVQALDALTDWRLVLVADRKTPRIKLRRGDVLDLPQQLAFSGSLGNFARALPVDHYSRKNLGYLIAIQRRSPMILETDDDNHPYPSFGSDCSYRVSAKRVALSGWANVYRLFTPDPVWPRGLPLEQVLPLRTSSIEPCQEALFDAPVQQYLADGDPDVDAVYRLTQPSPISFSKGTFYLEPGAWSPWNSQNTLWFPPAYPLLYLPSHVTFRMTDIWRSFVATAVLAARGVGIVFHGPTVRQDRNEHNLIMDFEQEVPGYLGNDSIMRLLQKTPLEGDASPQGTCHDLTLCYRALIKGGFVPSQELDLLQSWNRAVLVAMQGDE